MHLLMRHGLAHSVNAFLVTLVLADRDLVYVAGVASHWIEKTNRFCYRRPTPRSKKTGNHVATPAVDGAEPAISAGSK
jgi:hypothetical protein